MKAHARTHAHARWPPQVQGGPRSLEFFWSCCGAYDRAADGCETGPHRSYDE